MRIVNPLYYPVAVLAGAITLFIGVRFVQLSSAIVIPLSVGVTIFGANYLKSRKLEFLELENSDLERELQRVIVTANNLAIKAKALHLEATKMLTDTFHLELLTTLQMNCNRAVELPKKIAHLSRRLQDNHSLLSVQQLEQQLAEVEQRLKSSSGVAKQHLSQLANSLSRNIQLAKEGQDIRLAQVVNISTLVQDATGSLQRSQTKLHTSDLSDSAQISELQSLVDEFSNIEANLELLVCR
ncbi:hypothetical protein F7734_55860 [Scytonema sp. UIC 10036]|uniref:hypothetical protein n=1 Tax=Scytonema sp. UIC 10036 TaxID=2304196 RepID=UPI0012DAF311|nr:hypothetical protein [Scytonema sp. UIC 10036]MUH01057.1 hypothetical protein [Scytonema sp. UIC 10036]